MKLKDILEARSPYANRTLAVVYPQTEWTPLQVLNDILGGRAVIPDGDDDSIKLGDYVVSHPWVGRGAVGIFSDMDCKPGEGGAIGLADLYGRTAQAIAAAAHEGFHAYLHLHGQNYKDERRVNELAEQWLRKHFNGPYLHHALEFLIKSRISYGHN